MRSFEYVTIEGQTTRVPIVVCADGGVVVRGSATVRELSAMRDSASARDSAGARDSASALDSAAACRSASALDSAAAHTSTNTQRTVPNNAVSLPRGRDIASSDAMFLARARKGALREIRARLTSIINLFTSGEPNAELRSRDRNTALRKTRANSEFQQNSETAEHATLSRPKNSTTTTTSTSAEFADQRIYANGS